MVHITNTPGKCCMTGEAQPGIRDLARRPPGTRHRQKLFLHTAVRCMEHSQSDKHIHE